ncbi:MAG: hypothetical protein ACLFQK_00655 [Fibrobacterota bacterium]
MKYFLIFTMLFSVFVFAADERSGAEGEAVKKTVKAGCNFVDKDNDGKCDNCKIDSAACVKNKDCAYRGKEIKNGCCRKIGVDAVSGKKSSHGKNNMKKGGCSKK